MAPAVLFCILFRYMSSYGDLQPLFPSLLFLDLLFPLHILLRSCSIWTLFEAESVSCEDLVQRGCSGCQFWNSRHPDGSNPLSHFRGPLPYSLTEFQLKFSHQLVLSSESLWLLEVLLLPAAQLLIEHSSVSCHGLSRPTHICAVGDVCFHLGFLLVLGVGFEFPILVFLSLFMEDAERLKNPAPIAIFPEFKTYFWTYLDK